MSGTDMIPFLFRSADLPSPVDGPAVAGLQAGPGVSPGDHADLARSMRMASARSLSSIARISTRPGPDLTSR